jgi:hypothetical protein
LSRMVPTMITAAMARKVTEEDFLEGEESLIGCWDSEVVF